MKKIFGGLIVVCSINLVPFFMTLFMHFSEEGELDYSIASSIRSLFSIPTGLLGYALHYDLGDLKWILLNVFGIIISIVFIWISEKLF